MSLLTSSRCDCARSQMCSNVLAISCYFDLAPNSQRALLSGAFLILNPKLRSHICRRYCLVTYVLPNEDLAVLVAGTPCDTENVPGGHEVQPDAPVTMRHSSNLDRIVQVRRMISAMKSESLAPPKPTHTPLGLHALRGQYSLIGQNVTSSKTQKGPGSRGCCRDSEHYTIFIMHEPGEREYAPALHAAQAKAPGTRGRILGQK